MSKNIYIAFGATAFMALVIVGTHAFISSNSNLYLSGNTAAVNQAAFSNTNNGKPPFPEISIGKEVRGEEIITALGSKLPEVANWYKLSEEELKKAAKDKTLRADKKGHLFYVDENTITAGNITSAGTGNLSQTGPLPLDQTFALHSKSGSPKTLYLDFNGYHFTAGKSAWISTDYDAPAFDLDGSPATFNDTERSIIQNVWLRVAEDFIPYDIDVTTEEPTADKLERSSSSDTIFGNRVLFTPASSTLHPNAGGVSYVGVFDDVGEFYKISLVFPENLANSDKYMADAAPHEAGHSLGLQHDGQAGVSDYYTGQGFWAPIMGVGYYKSLVEWSKGEYSNPSNTQDDLQVMQSFGLSYRTDDYGNTLSTAGNAAVSGNSLSATGIIERTNDIDFIKFNSGAGDIVINLAEANPSPTLDAELTLYNGSGQIIAQQNNAGQSGESISANVPGGTYYISVKGTGYGNSLIDGYTSYGSLGQYYINGTIVGTNNNPPVASISANPTSGSPALTVQFSSSGSYDPDNGSLTYLWNFGDNTTSTEQNPTKIYTNGGTYTATLTITDQNNLSVSKSIQIAVVNQAPIASFTTSYSSSNVPMTVSFDASGSTDPNGTISAYTWNFGDNSSASGITANHTYNQDGTYAAQLTVTDATGLTSTKSISLTAVDPNAVNAPTSLSASIGGKVKGQVTLKWSDQSSNETAFYIERATAVKTGTATYQTIKQINANTTTFADIVSANTYYYRVRAYNATTGTYSLYSNVVQVRVR